MSLTTQTNALATQGRFCYDSLVSPICEHRKSLAMPKAANFHRIISVLIVFALGIAIGTLLQKYYPVGNIVRDIGVASGLRPRVQSPSSPSSYMGERLVIPPTPSGSGIPLKILIVGNSLAVRLPDLAVSWTGSWGMAASSQDKDFSHILYAHISTKTPRPVEMRIQSFVDFERDFEHFDFVSVKEYQDYQADLIILRIGDNVSHDLTAGTDFKRYYQKLIAFLSPTGKAYFVATSSWFPSEIVDQSMRGACIAPQCAFVDLSKLYADYSNSASAERAFDFAVVGRHPGDKGMKAIADAIGGAVDPWIDKQGK